MTLKHLQNEIEISGDLIILCGLTAQRAYLISENQANMWNTLKNSDLDQGYIICTKGWFVYTLDQTPTPTRFLKTADVEVSQLFEEINPFDQVLRARLETLLLILREFGRII